MITLSISIEPDLDAEMALFAERAKRSIETGQYQGEYLNFSHPATFFSQMTPHRWNILSALMGKDTVGVRELARKLGRDAKRTNDDANALVQLGLLEKTERGALRCPYTRIDIDMSLTAFPLLPDTIRARKPGGCGRGVRRGG